MIWPFSQFFAHCRPARHQALDTALQEYAQAQQAFQRELSRLTNEQRHIQELLRRLIAHLEQERQSHD